MGFWNKFKLISEKSAPTFDIYWHRCFDALHLLLFDNEMPHTAHGWLVWLFEKCYKLPILNANDTQTLLTSTMLVIAWVGSLFAITSNACTNCICRKFSLEISPEKCHKTFCLSSDEWCNGGSTVCNTKLNLKVSYAWQEIPKCFRLRPKITLLKAENSFCYERKKNQDKP